MPQPPAALTVGAWVETWLETYGQNAGYSANATNGYNCAKIKAALGAMPIDQVREAHIQRLANAYANRSKSFVTKLRVTVNAIFSRAVGNCLIDRNPCEGVKWNSVGEGTHRALDAWEVAHIAANWREHRAGLWAMLMLYAGLRRGELVALKWSSIDLPAGVIHIRTGIHFEGNEAVMGRPKTAAGIRDVPLFPPLRAAFERVQLPPQSNYVCCAVDGTPLTLAAWDRAWDGYLAAMENLLNDQPAYMPGRRSDKDAEARRRFSVRAHDLRHTFCTMLYDAGVDIKTAQELMGHSDMKMTMKIYTHLSELKRDRSVEKMTEFTSKKQ